MLFSILLAYQAAVSAEGPLSPIADNADLPRVLIIGDSISIGYTSPVRLLLQEEANIHRPATNCAMTRKGLEQLDKWLGDEPWDVIHFNWGLHDLKFINGERQIPLDKYRENLEALVDQLSETGATLVWCSTTPVPTGVRPPRTNDDVLAYNGAALEIMESHEILVDDLYTFAAERLDDIQQPNNVHFSPEGSQILAEQVARSIQEALRQRSEEQ